MKEMSENALTVLKKRYLWKDENGNTIETPTQMFARVADFLFPDDTDMCQIAFDLMEKRIFLPNTPTLINAGRPDGQLSACFVLPVGDSMDEIFTTVHDTAMIHKTGGGTGFSFSRLRQKGARVASTGGESSGVCSFIRVFDAATESVSQGGVRRGANMGLLRIDHPEIRDFIMCKDDTSVLHNFNLSVGIVDGFMECVEKDLDWPLIAPHTGETVETVKARDLWDALVHQAWKNGEPGVIFLDTMNKSNPTPELGEIESTNPCGEQPLLPYESCNLGSIDVSKLLYQDGGDWYMDWDELERVTQNAVEILNAVLDHNTFPLDKIREATLRTRKIGLGVMGWADTLLRMGIPYDSEEALRLARKVMRTINDAAHDYSAQRDFRNATCTTIAPTGTISMIADCSSGIEPNFSWVYTRNSMDQLLYVVHPLMEEELRKRHRYNDDVLSALHAGKPLREIPGLEDMADVWKTSQEISPIWHVEMQAAFQAYTDNAVSKTINLPNDATEETISTLLLNAHELGCKGLTVYRDGSRENQVLNHAPAAPAAPEAESAGNDATRTPTRRKRPRTTYGTTTEYAIGCGKLYVTVNRDADGQVIEVFTTTGKYGGCPSQSEATARAVSLALKYGVPLADVREQLRGIQCKNCVHRGQLDAMSCPDAIGRALEAAEAAEDIMPEPIATETPQDKPAPVEAAPADSVGYLCPECGEPLEHVEGCLTCHSCGYSRCT